MNGIAYGIPIAKEPEFGFMFEGPAVFFGKIADINDGTIGKRAIETLNMYREISNDDELRLDILNDSFRKFGYKSYDYVFKRCLTMEIESENEKCRLTPYERVKERGVIGAIPLEVELFSKLDDEELGSAVRKCISLCK